MKNKNIEEIKCKCNEPYGYKLLKEVDPELYYEKAGKVTCILCMDHMRGYKCDKADCGTGFCDDCLKMY